MASIAAAVLGTPPRISLTLTGWANNGALAIYRVHPDGTRWLVRGSQGGDTTVTVTAGVAAVFDDEAPHMQAVTYQALSGGTTVTSGAVTITLAGGYLSVPGLPSFRIPVELIAKPSAIRPRPRTVMRPRGRTKAVVIGDNRKGREFALRIRTRTFDQARLLEEVTDQAGTLLLRMPGTRWAWTYVDIGDLSDEAVTPYRAQTGIDPTEVGAWEEWTLPCIETSPPVGGVYGDPTASWDALNATGKTWDQLKVAGVTWLDRARGAW